MWLHHLLVRTLLSLRLVEAVVSFPTSPLMVKDSPRELEKLFQF